MPAQIIFGDVNTLDPAELRAVLKENNISRIDTAAVYQNGESEKIIGRAKLPADFTIDTKIRAARPAAGHLTPEKIEKSLTNSLEQLGMKKVNVIYCHAPDGETPIAEQAKAFSDQYVKGRFTYLGVSNFSVQMLQEWLDIAEKEGYVKPTWFQGQYNLLCRSYEDELFPLLRKNGIHFAGYSPLAGGFLLGNFTQEGVQAGKRFSMGSPYNKWYDHASMHKAIKKLKTISEKTGLGMDELSFRWEKYHSVLKDDDVIIMGASKIEQIGRSVKKAERGPLEAGVVKELNSLWDLVKEDGKHMTDFSKM